MIPRLSPLTILKIRRVLFSPVPLSMSHSSSPPTLISNYSYCSSRSTPNFPQSSWSFFWFPWRMLLLPLLPLLRSFNYLCICVIFHDYMVTTLRPGTTSTPPVPSQSTIQVYTLKTLKMYRIVQYLDTGICSAQDIPGIWSSFITFLESRNCNII